MSRAIWAAIAGYVTIMVFVFGLFSLAFMVLGADGVFQPASFEVTRNWLVVSMVINAMAGSLGGIVALSMRGNRRSLIVLSVLILAFGALMAVQVLNAPDDPMGSMRTAPVTNFEAMMRARQPMWLAIVNPLIAVAAVMAGAALRRRPE